MTRYPVVTVYYQLHMIEADTEEEAFLAADDHELGQILQPGFMEELKLSKEDRLTVQESEKWLGQRFKEALANLGTE